MNLAQAEVTINDLTDKNEELQSKVETLEIKLAKALRALRRNQSEKLDPAELLEGCYEFLTQEELELLGELVESGQDHTEEEEDDRPKRKKRKKRPANIEFQEQPVAVPPEECECPHCAKEMPVIGYDSVEKWGHQPAIIYGVRFLLEKRACSCGKGIATAKVPPHPIPRCKALPDLLAQVMVGKFVDGLPFYRQSKIYERAGLEIGDTTMVEWCRQVTDVLEPVCLVLQQQVLATGYVQADETGLRIQAKGGCEQGWLWAYGRPHDQVFFDFRSSRSRDGPNQILDGFEGNLQTDGWSSYNEIAGQENILHFACWAHVRRYFIEAKEKSKLRAGKILKLIQKLYRIERESREGNFSAEHQCSHRQAHAVPILEAIKSNLAAYTQEPKYLPKSPLGQAVAYTLRRWDQLTRYVDHGDVEIDNNLIENSMRGVAVTRKNFLFAGSEAGAERAAVLFSLVESCRRLGLNPHEYLTDVLTRLPETPLDQLDALTPLGWKNAREAEATPQA